VVAVGDCHDRIVAGCSQKKSPAELCFVFVVLVILPVIPGMIHALVFHAPVEFYPFPQFLDATEEDTILHLTPKPRGPVDGPFPPRRCQLEPLLLGLETVG
jgi:hypothetical protein